MAGLSMQHDTWQESTSDKGVSMEDRGNPIVIKALAAEISRRRFLKRISVGVAAVGEAQFLAACGAFGG